MPALSDAKHEAVAQALVTDPERIGWRAYQAVYPRSSKAASATAWSRLLRNAEFCARIAELQEKAGEKAAVTDAQVIAELVKIGFANMADYMRAGDNGDPFLDFSKLTRDQAAALAEVTVEDFLDGRGEDSRQVRRVKFKLCDKRAALVDIGRHLGMWKDKVEHSGVVELALSERLDRAIKRIEAPATERSNDEHQESPPGRPARKRGSRLAKGRKRPSRSR